MRNIIEAKPLSDYRLFVVFDDGTEGILDLSHLVGNGVFSAWKDLRVFNAVKVTEYGALEWPGEIDLCADALYMQLTEKKPDEMFSSLRHLTAHA